MVAISFIVFDVEAVLLLPWAAHYKEMSCAAQLVNDQCPAGNVSAYGFVVMLIFMTVLVIGLLWEWKKGALQWD
jgi:NADH-quinone oxidoreductase subunit A